MGDSLKVNDAKEETKDDISNEKVEINNEEKISEENIDKVDESEDINKTSI